VSILDWAAGENIGFSKFISLGNKAVLDEIDMLEYLGADPATKVILGYIESIQRGEMFMRAAREVSRNKPIIMLKAGSTAAGAKAASSHTGAIAGSDNAYEAAFKQSGIVRAEDVESLFHLASAFASLPLPRGPNVAIVTNAGGPGILAADACEKRKLHLARLGTETVQRLQNFLPPYASLYNPVDIISDAGTERCRKALEAVLADPLVHSVLMLLTPTNPLEMDGVATVLSQLARRSDKPVYFCLMGRAHVDSAKAILTAAGLPCFNFPEAAAQSIEAMYTYALWRQMPVPEYASPARNLPAAQKIIADALAKGQTEIVEQEARGLAEAYQLHTPRTQLARTSTEAGSIAEAIGFPVVLKIASSQIAHKTDVGGVVLSLASKVQVQTTFREITNRAQRLRPDAYVSGCLVQKMATTGAREIIVGFKRDEQFGPLLVFGLGGIHTEILKDVSFRLLPLSRAEAFGMIREIRSYLFLKGVEGGPEINFSALVDVLLVLSAMASDFPAIYEAEFNPVLVDHERALVADVRITLRS
jgi:acetyltransferase